ncbi:MAG: hydrogenase maturation protease [Candidatus Omnitrophota bacterium]
MERNTQGTPAGPEVKTLILGMGNTILSDDGVGILLVRELKKSLAGRPGVDIRETPLAGLNLVYLLEGYHRAIIIDAMETRTPEPGKIHRLDLADFASTMHLTSPHGINLYTALEVGCRCGLRMPESVTILAIEVENTSTFSTRCSPHIETLMPEIKKNILLTVNAELRARHVTSLS